MGIEMNNGLTKIVNKKCQDCGEHVSILCNEKCYIVTARCPECLRIFLIASIEIEQLVNYLKKKDWKEIPIELPRIEMVAPHPQLNVFIPIDKSPIDYIQVMKHIFNTIAQYYDKTITEILLEILQEKGEDF